MLRLGSYFVHYALGATAVAGSFELFFKGLNVLFPPASSTWAEFDRLRESPLSGPTPYRCGGNLVAPTDFGDLVKHWLFLNLAEGS
jgi:hypothetical protein